MTTLLNLLLGALGGAIAFVVGGALLVWIVGWP